MEAIAPNGKGKGSSRAAGSEKLSFFVARTAPGDVITACVTGARKRYVEAELVEVIEASRLRVEPICPHYDECGGCQVMHLSYAAQLDAKREIVRYILARHGFDRELAGPVVASPSELRYRLRSKLFLTPELTPGLRAWRSHRVVPIRQCFQMHTELERGLLGAARFAPEMLASRSPVATLLGVCDLGSGRVLLQAGAAGEDAPRIAGWFTVDEKGAHGETQPLCRVQAAGFDLQYAPDCFTQVNADANDLLVAHAVQAMAVRPTDSVLELFSGIGNFTLPLATRARSVTAVEWPRATRFAKDNAKKAGLSNIAHLGKDVVDALRDLTGRQIRFDRALLDPPREGLGETGCNLLSEAAPQRIVYVSCEPTTLAADLASLTRQSYRLVSVTPFDMFPQTFHVETCAIMDKE